MDYWNDHVFPKPKQTFIYQPRQWWDSEATGDRKNPFCSSVSNEQQYQSCVWDRCLNSYTIPRHQSGSLNFCSEKLRTLNFTNL